MSVVESTAMDSGTAVIVRAVCELRDSARFVRDYGTAVQEAEYALEEAQQNYHAQVRDFQSSVASLRAATIAEPTKKRLSSMLGPVGKFRRTEAGADWEGADEAMVLFMKESGVEVDEDEESEVVVVDDDDDDDEDSDATE